MQTCTKTVYQFHCSSVLDRGENVDRMANFFPEGTEYIHDDLQKNVSLRLMRYWTAAILDMSLQPFSSSR